MKEKKKNIKLIFVVVLSLAVLVPGLIWLAHRLEGKKPRVEVFLPTAAVGASQEISVSVDDPGSGIREVTVSVIGDGKESVLAEEAYPSAGALGGGQVKTERLVVRLAPKELELADGEAVLRVVADDYSWRRWWNGNRRVLETPVRIDTRSPLIEVLTKVHNISQGGSGVVAYRIDEDCPRHGVRAGERFFPGHPAPYENADFYLAFFALAYDQDDDTPLVVEARDAAGNIGTSGFSHHIRSKRFRTDKIRISDRFLKKILPRFDSTVPALPEEPPVDRFLRINRELRKENYRQLTRIGDTTEPRIIWEGAFGRLPGSARRSSFADHRRYLYRGRMIDRQVHLGIDLASTAHSPVPAANSGRVAFAGEVGIYGKTVAIDHGFGLFSFYSHLSRIDVKPDDVVSKGDILGRTGTSGLAGGDHLHFSMMVARTFVDPVEWWDAGWIQNNITAKLQALAAEYGNKSP